MRYRERSDVPPRAFAIRDGVYVGYPERRELVAVWTSEAEAAKHADKINMALQHGSPDERA